MIHYKNIFLFLFYLLAVADIHTQVPIWSKHELNFASNKALDNPLYQLKDFHAVFTSPSGRKMKISGFWDGGSDFKVRFAPDEFGAWKYQTYCSDTLNAGLHNLQGAFDCVKNQSEYDIYRRGAIKRSMGDYHLTYTDGTPFFYVACTAWNGALKSTDDEWDDYLTQRRENNYNVIQFVTTQWRGCEKDKMGEVAFTGSGKISLNPAFFQRLDKKVDEINAEGLIAAPVLLWALPVGQGREFSPGYYLPENEAVLLAKYLVARYGGNQVIWILGGDGRYINEYEQRWKRIGREVFSEPHPGLVAQHPHGISWIGEAYKDEDWLDIVGYQSSHSNGERTVNWINKGEIAQTWHQLPPKPIINLEPNYEEIQFLITAEDVRNASWWSVFATPPSGITYGANGIWPWIQYDGELVENHGNPDGKGPSTWRKSIEFQGSKQIGYLATFISQYRWWELKPHAELLLQQPGEEVFNHFISIVADDQLNYILTYTPIQQDIQIRNLLGYNYEITWFDPATNQYRKAGAVDSFLISLRPPSNQDYVLILKRSDH
ncbi:MAG: DUF4038 domain-containing protein [Saprospiraceae bacterium]|nr:DUF4038 domain-containing protein [Saprospiraceae bacterium]